MVWYNINGYFALGAYFVMEMLIYTRSSLTCIIVAAVKVEPVAPAVRLAVDNSSTYIYAA